MITDMLPPTLMEPEVLLVAADSVEGLGLIISCSILSFVVEEGVVDRLGDRLLRKELDFVIVVVNVFASDVVPPTMQCY